MLVEFKCENFLSFQEELEFTLTPNRVSKRFEKNINRFGKKERVMKMALLFGENGGGKTNFIKSLDFFKNIITRKTEPKAIKSLSFCGNNDLPQKFEITVLLNDTYITYKLHINKTGIVFAELSKRNVNSKVDKVISSMDLLFDTHEFNIEDKREDKREDKKEDNIFSILNKLEKLSYIENPSINEKKLTRELIPKLYDMFQNFNIDTIENILERVSLIQILDKSLEDIKLNLEKNQPDESLEEIILNLEKNETYNTFINWITNNLIIELPQERPVEWYKESENKEHQVEILKTPEYFEIFQIIDSTIEKIIIDEYDPFRDTKIIRNDGAGKIFTMSLKEESEGIKEFFKLSIFLYNIIHEDKTVIIDEVDSVLNTIITSKIVNLINGSDHKGQLIFSTHNVINLNTGDLMKEQIYFITKNSTDIKSELYSLGDFSDVRYDGTDIYKLYLKGIFGGVPNA